MNRLLDSWQAGPGWDLPPLILHPMESRRAGLETEDAETEALLRGRYAEFRMLALAGKDVMRWIAQCMDFAGRDERLASAGIQPQSFADLLVNQTPPGVIARFEGWA